MDANKHNIGLDGTLRGFIRAAGFVLSSALAFANSGARFNEIDVHKVNSSVTLPLTPTPIYPQYYVDTLEFIELKGVPNASLVGHMLLVVDGDSTNAGVLDRAIDLGAFALNANGLFVLGDSALVPKDLDLGAYDQIENGTTTFYLVTTTNQALITSLVGARINGPGNTTLIGSVATIIDRIAIADADYPTLDVVYDATTVMGPDGGFLPAGIVRCGSTPSGWSTIFGDYDSALPSGAAPTPGAANPACDAGVGFCFGDGSGSNCPCGNNTPVGAKEGCQSSSGFGGKLRAIGSASMGSDSLVLVGTQMPDGPVLYFQATLSLPQGSAFGDGLLCAGGGITRLGVKFNVGGTSSHPGPGDPAITVQGQIIAPGTFTYQGWYRSAMPFCTPATYNLTHGVQVQWGI